MPPKLTFDALPETVDHTPRVHPASPSDFLPPSFTSSFAQYRDRAQQHGPLHTQSNATAAAAASFASPFGAASSIGASSGASLGGGLTTAPGEGRAFDRCELPARFGRLPFSETEMEAVETGGASLVA